MNPAIINPNGSELTDFLLWGQTQPNFKPCGPNLSEKWDPFVTTYNLVWSQIFIQMSSYEANLT